MMDFVNSINQLWDAIFTQAGLVASLLFVGYIHQTRQVAKKEKQLQEQNDKVLQLAVSQVTAMKEVQNVLDRIADILGRSK